MSWTLTLLIYKHGTTPQICQLLYTLHQYIHIGQVGWTGGLVNAMWPLHHNMNSANGNRHGYTRMFCFPQWNDPNPQKHRTHNNMIFHQQDEAAQLINFETISWTNNKMPYELDKCSCMYPTWCINSKQ